MDRSPWRHLHDTQARGRVRPRTRRFLLAPLAAAVISTGLYSLERAGAAPRVDRARPAGAAAIIADQLAPLGPATMVPVPPPEVVAAAAEPVSAAAAATQPFVDGLRGLGERQQALVDRMSAAAGSDPDDARQVEQVLSEISAFVRQAVGPAQEVLAQAEGAGLQAVALAAVCNCAAEMAAVAAARAAVLAAARTLRDRLATLGALTGAATLICAFFFVTPACLAALAAVAAATIAVSFAQDDLLAENARLRRAVAALAACEVRVRRDPACRPPSG